MLLRKLATIICIKGTGSEYTKITVKTHRDGRILWKGIAKDLKTFTRYNRHWVVIEITIDHDDKSNPYDYNKGKIITVMYLCYCFFTEELLLCIVRVLLGNFIILILFYIVEV